MFGIHSTPILSQNPTFVYQGFSYVISNKIQMNQVDSFLTRLRTQAPKCNFNTPDDVDDNILGQLIKGVHHGEVRKKLLDHPPSTLTLDKAMDFARTFEATETQLLQFNTETTVNAVKRQQKQQTKGKQQPKAQKQSNCRNCGLARHETREDCPAKESKCNKCHRIGHWGKVCLNPQNPLKQTNKQQGHRGKKIQAIQHDSQDSEDHLSATFENFTFSPITVNAHSNTECERTQVSATIIIEPHKGIKTNLKGKVDTGAEGNILPLRVFKQIFPRSVKLTSSTASLTDYNGGKIQQYGTITMPCSYKNRHHEETFYVADAAGPVIFGLQTCERLGLVTVYCAISNKPDNPVISSVKHLQDMYPDRFDGLGKFPDVQKLQIDGNATPVKHAPRRAPIQLRDKIKSELKRMVDLDVIRPVEQPTDWVSSITYVQKADGSLRICLDPKDINNVLKRGQHHTPTVEELTHKFSGASHFSKLDAKSGYWAVQLDPES